MTKILYIITQGEMGGAQKYVHDLATSLSSRGALLRGDPEEIASGMSPRNDTEYKVIVAMGGEKTELGGKLKVKNKKIKIVYLNNLIRNIHPIKDLQALFEIKRLIKAEKPDIVHLNSSKAGVIGSLAGWRAGNKNIIFTAHGLAYLEPNGWLVRAIYYWTERFATLFRRRVICVSEFDRQEAIKSKLGPAEKFITIHNGIEKFEILPRDEARAFLNSKFNIQNSKYIIGTIAHNYKTKDLPTLRQAFKILQNEMSLRGRSPKQSHGTATRPAAARSDNKNLKLVIIGRGSEYGEIPEARKYLSAFDIYVSSSVKEGFPYSVLEAAAAGLPIVATNVGGIPEMINSSNSILVPTKNPEAMAEAIKKLIDNPALAQTLGKNAQITARRFSIEQMVKETALIYRDAQTQTKQ